MMEKCKEKKKDFPGKIKNRFKICNELSVFENP
jgi:hypothetical protein